MKARGTTTKGFPSPAEEELVDSISFDEYLVPHKESSYILKVKGEAMQDAGILEGDMVVVERRSAAAPGQIVIALVDDEYVMRYLRKRDGRLYLEAASAEFSPFEPNETLRIEAVVTALVRKY